MIARRSGIRVFRIANGTIVLLIILIAITARGVSEALAAAAGGAYSLITILLYEVLAGKILFNRKSVTLFVLPGLAKAIFVCALIWVLLRSPSALYIPWFLAGLLSFVPASLVLVFRKGDSSCC